ncbi:hypothetical protein DFQ28_008154 [Apophysomyces sp. BC1034]|nr:hypothetical protein DFQ30_007868 [Apophysomyces sp. BC1015]KAG0176173.1 hypothetical protein DFQ29_006453 [Apophysomyces sp. BC1021]KAG0186225.1 hypothetical protein DFQ28_008154 [Apophysomyces sp. BC1034]
MTTPQVNSSDGCSLDIEKKQDSPVASIITHGLSTPTSPPYPPYYVDPQVYEHCQPGAMDPNDSQAYAAYLYPLSPQFSVQYYSDGYRSYPGSPALYPQSPPVNPSSPPFSPTFQYQQAGMIPPPSAYILPPHSAPQPYHITSPVLTGTASVPGSPPHHYIPLPLPEHRHKHQETQHHLQNIYVRGLSPSTTDDSFLDLCAVYGKIASSKAMIDQKSGECKGYGFAMFEREEDCHKAIDGLNKTGLQASFARMGQESFSSRLRNLQDETSTNIYISNLPLGMTEQKLDELFQPFQTISNRILRDPYSGLSRGVGFARMADRTAAATIIERFNGQTIAGSSAPLQVRFADSPAQKKLKSQSSRKRIFRTHQPMTGFPVRPMMPITPETMLGFAPMVNQPYIHDYHHQYVNYPRHFITPETGHKLPDALASPPDDEVADLTAAVEQKLSVATHHETTTAEE